MKIDWTTIGPAILGGVVVGALAGGLLRGGPDMKKHHQDMAEAVAAKVAESSQPLADRLAALEAAVAAQPAVDTAALIAEMQAIRADVDASLATQEEAQAMLLTMVHEYTGKALATQAPVDAEPAPAAAAEAAPATPGTSTGVGETALLLDGKIRAFVSRVTEDSAAVAVNGVDTVALALGEAVGVLVDDQHCAVLLDSVDQGRAVLAANCAAAPTEATAAPADAPTTSTGIALASAAAIGLGETAIFGNGKLRAFVARLEADAAVLSINTGDKVRIALGDTAQGPVDDTLCALSVVSITDGKVELSGGCAN